MAYVRIERDDYEPGKKHIAMADRILAIGDDGSEVEFSAAVLEWQLNSRVGDVRTLTLTLASFDLPGGD